MQGLSCSLLLRHVLEVAAVTALGALAVQAFSCRV